MFFISFLGTPPKTNVVQKKQLTLEHVNLRCLSSFLKVRVCFHVRQIRPPKRSPRAKKSCAASFGCRFYVSVLATSKVPYFDIFLAREESRRFLCWLFFLIFLFCGSPGMTTNAGSMLKKSLIDFQFHVSFRKSKVFAKVTCVVYI